MRLLNHDRVHDQRGGFALLTVLLVLLALLVLCAPFLMTARNASKASTQLADRAQARLALDSASRNARAHLGQSHPARDLTPYYDDESELAVERAFAPDFINAHDPKGVMWDAVVRDVAGSLDWNSAPPQVFANALEATTRLTAPAKKEDKELSVSTTFGFPPAGFLWVGREMVGYSALDPQKFKQLVRGIGSRRDQEGNAQKSGPQPASDHALSTIVIDQRAYAPALWRSKTPDGHLRQFDAPEQVRECADLAPGIDAAAAVVADEAQLKARKEDREKDFRREAVFADERLLALRAFVEPIAARCSTFAGVRAGRQWQKPVRVKNAIRAGLDDQLEVDELKWFNPGSTVMVTDGKTTELGLVVEVAEGKVRLMEPLANHYTAFMAEARVLARRPVDINLCEREVLEILFANLQIARTNDRITRDEAEQLAELVLESRPFTGFEDFLRRIVLPAAGLEKLPSGAPVVPDVFAAGGTLIDAYDAVALYTNALNANDATLAYSTMPFAFTTRDVYDFDLRAVVNAPSGVERLTLTRDEVEMIVPQRDLMQLWARQEDWDELLRLDREAPYWSSGPSATSMYDPSMPAWPPSRWKPNIGTAGGRTYIPGITPVGEGEAAPAATDHTFASREDAGWVQLWPSRVDEMGHRAGHVEHFDSESRDPEGRYLPDQPIKELTSSKRVEWVDPNATTKFLRAFNFSTWFKPRQLIEGTYLDVGTSSLETDRVLLAIEGSDLVLRVFDAGGDLSETPLREAGEARYALALGDGAGLAADTWSHVAIDVAGTRPSQVTMLVDGRAIGVRTPGLTRLAASLTDSSDVIRVESDEGFPTGQGAHAVLRIGQELIECTWTGRNTYSAIPGSGASYGFGGRLARVPFSVTSGDPGLADTSVIQAVSGSHAKDTPVELYGYSAVVPSEPERALLTGDAVVIPNGSSSLPSALGKFAVGMVKKGIGGPQTGEAIAPTNFLTGWRGIEGPGSAVTALELEEIGGDAPIADVMAAFCPSGGYAALVQVRATFRNDTTGQQVTDAVTQSGAPVGGVEIIKYSGVDGQQLRIAQRAARRVGNLPQIAHAFVTDWGAWYLANAQGTLLNSLLDWQLFVVPISIPAPGAQPAVGFLLPRSDASTAPPTKYSEFAQITRLDQPDRTEWVRYDSIAEGHLIRDDYLAINHLAEALTLRQNGAGANGGWTPPPPLPPGGGGPGNPGGPTGPGTNPSMVMSSPTAPSTTSAAEPAVAQQANAYLWQAYWGTEEHPEWSLTRAARSEFQFRGVFGTYPHEHDAGTVVLPVWRASSSGVSQTLDTYDVTSVDRGQLGRYDDVILMDDLSASLGWPARIFRSWRPFNYARWNWVPGAVPSNPNATQPATAGMSVPRGEDLGVRNYAAIYVALDAAARAPVSVASSNASGVGATYDTRELARVLKHPSGELPRVCDNAVVGGTIRNESPPSAFVDELVYGSTQFGVSTPLRGGQLVVSQAFSVGSTSLQLDPDALRIAFGLVRNSGTDDVASQLPTDAGLLRVGDEIVCYSSLDSSSGGFSIPSNGRGLLGTTAGSHEPGETAHFLDGWTVGVLAGQVSATASSLVLTDVTDFPQYGTVLVDDELIHYTRIAGATLDMPRRSKEPGEKDSKGDGLFRGRFGTTAAGHAALSPVILFPFRYWDRWAEKADAPELAYVSPCIDQPNAFWRNVFWTTEQPSSGQSRIEVMQRLLTRGESAPPWDGDPQTTPGLKLLTDGMGKGEGNSIAAPADLIEWRAFVRYDVGAFDARSGLSHGWKETPRLKAFGVEYLGPNLVLRRVDE